MARPGSDRVSNKKMFERGGRDYTIDILRCLSCLMVVSGHVAGLLPTTGWSAASDSATTGQYILVFLRCFNTSATDIFLMISGVFFLSPERNITPRKIWGKNILKMSTALILWLILYGMFETLTAKETFDLETVAHNVIYQDNKHLWYIPMMIGVYIFVPLFRVFSENAKKFHYRYLFIIVALASIIEQIDSFYKVYKFDGSDIIHNIFTKTPYQYILHLFVFPIIGYWLYSARTKRSFRCLMYVLGLAGVITMYLMEVAIYKQTGMLGDPQVLGKLSAGNFFKCVGIFLFITTILDGINVTGLAKIIITKLSGATLFIYLSHWMGISFLISQKWLFHGFWQSHIVLTAIIYIIVIYGAGFLFSVVFLQSIPWIGIRNKIFDAIAPNRTIYVTKKK